MVDTMEKWHEGEEAERTVIDMEQDYLWPCWQESNLCNSPGCHAGDYLLAKIWEEEQRDEQKIKDEALSSMGDDEREGYFHGDRWFEERAHAHWTDQMAEDNPDLSDEELEHVIMTSDISFLSDWAQDEFDGAFCSSGRQWQLGAQMMAEDLGFDAYEQLQEWAKDHPGLWGNEDGVVMFSENCAFGVDTGITLYASDIINHWKGVGKRLKEKESKERLI